ncbi:MAG: hypothetical protein JNK48_23675 [Bryobacterales bacterium]|nr:hypothetical protein [Bryobacterales bacterium]
MKALRYRRPILLMAIAAVSVVAVGVWLRQAQNELELAESALRREGEIGFSESAVERAPAAFEPIGTASGFRDVALFQDDLWIITASSLEQRSPQGDVVRVFTTGRDLPPAPLAKMAAGLAGAAAHRQLFLATAGEGLLVFDGSGFRQIRAQAQGYRQLTALLPLETGQVLLGTARNGVLAWDGRRLSVFHPSLAGLPVTALGGKLDDLWIGTLDQGVIHLRAGEVTRIGSAQGLPDNHVLSIAVEGSDVWVGTPMGVGKIGGGRFERTYAEGFFANAILPREGRLLIGTLEEGVLEIDASARRPHADLPLVGRQQGHVEKLFEAGGELHALFRDGLSRRSAGRSAWIRVGKPQPAPLTDGNIAALAAEAGGKLWVGYFDRGLDILLPNAAAAIHREDDRLFCVNRILPGRDGAAIGTANGLVFTDSSGQTRRILTREEGLIATHVTDLVEDGAGLIAATPAGISFLTPSGPQSIYAFHGLVNNHVYTLTRLGTRLVAGTLGGVSVLENGVVAASYTTANSPLRQNWISASAAAGSDWFIGTYGAGVYRFDGATWHSFPDLRGQIEINPNAMLATSVAVYAGTLHRGLAVYGRASNRWNFVVRGLPSTNVTALTYSDGFVYIGTDNGIVRIAESGLH